MSLVEFLTFVLGCSGITIIIVMSYVLEPVREFLSKKSRHIKKLLSCTMCTGFWVGAIASIWFSINPIFAGAISSLVSWAASSVVEAFNMFSLYIDSLIEDGEEDERSVE